MKSQTTFKLFTQTLLATSLAAMFGTAVALPTGGVVAAGGAVIIPQTAVTMQIDAPVGNSVINWTGFNIAAGEQVMIRASDPAAMSGMAASGVVNLLNRISGGQTTINGALTQNVGGTATIHSYFINPNGFLITGVGAGTQIQSGGISGSQGIMTFTANNVTDAAFLAGTAPSGGQTLTNNMFIPGIAGLNNTFTGVGAGGTQGVIPAAGVPVVPVAATLPTAGVVAAGTASISNQATCANTNYASCTNITVRSNAVIDWTGFDVAAGNAVFFMGIDPAVLPGTGRPSNAVFNVLNRVAAAGSSTINGTIEIASFPSSGLPVINAYIINPNGVILGAGGVIKNTYGVSPGYGITYGGTVTLSSSNVANAAFLAGTMPIGTTYDTTLGAAVGGAAAGGGATGGGAAGGGGGAVAGNTLSGLLPGLNSYMAQFNAAQNAAMAQFIALTNQNPGLAQSTANAITQSIPQAVAQTQTGMSQAIQQLQASGAPAQSIAIAQGLAGAAPGLVNNVLAGAAQSLASGGAAGLQNFLFGNSLQAVVSNGLVNLF